MQIVRQLSRATALALVLGVSLAVAGCDKKDDDTEESDDDDDDDDDDKSSDKDTSAAKGTEDPAASDSATVDPATPTPTSTTPPNKVIVDAGAPAKDAGAAKADGGTTAKPGTQACLQKCANLLGQCTTSQAKDAGPFAIPNLAKCQAAAESCRKACGH